MSTQASGGTPGHGLWNIVPQFRAALEPKLDGVWRARGAATKIDVETAAPGQDGETRHYQASFYPLSPDDRSGMVDDVGMVVADITERKRAERKIQDSEERLRT